MVTHDNLLYNDTRNLELLKNQKLEASALGIRFCAIIAWE